MSLAAYVTDIGKARLAAAAAGGDPVSLATGAVGDGGGAPITPSPAMTALVNPVWTAPLSSLGLDPENPSTVLVEFVVPVNAGGWWAREAGILADDGALIAVAAFPETYKPLPDDGAGTSLHVVVPIPVTDAASVVFNVDSNQIYVSRYAFDQEMAELQDLIDDHAGRTDNPHEVSCGQIGAALADHGHPALEAHPPRTDNPHQVSCGQIGASPVGHNHDTLYGASLGVSGQTLTLVSRSGSGLGSVSLPAVSGYGKNLGLAGQVLSLLSETGGPLGQVTLPAVSGYGKSLSLAGQVLSLLSETGGLLSQVTLGKRYESGQQAITSAGMLTLAHGLGGAPWMIQVLLVCVTAEAGYSAGDVIYAPVDSGGNQGYSVIADATNIFVKFGSYTAVFEAQHKDTGLDTDLTNTNWRVVVRAMA